MTPGRSRLMQRYVAVKPWKVLLVIKFPSQGPGAARYEVSSISNGRLFIAWKPIRFNFAVCVARLQHVRNCIAYAPSQQEISSVDQSLTAFRTLLGKMRILISLPDINIR